MRIDDKIKSILNLSTDASDIVYSKRRLMKHIVKRNHEDIIKYFDEIENIIETPDYVGVNPNEEGISLEYVKVFDDNVLVALKLHKSKNHFYIPTMYSINDYKLKRRILSGRMKRIDKKK